MQSPNWKVWLNDKKECEIWLKRYTNKKVLIKSHDESKLHLKKTEHNLNFANWLFDRHRDSIQEFFGDEKFYDWVVSIYYYAVYHSALALVSNKKHKSISHSASLCFLIYYYYHKKQLEKEDIEIAANSLNREDIETIGIAKELRERASYNVHEIFEEKLADNARREALNFINKVKAILNKI